ncbi:unnamed protein product [Ambrosiozyma monospora]|uniref:Unnamed protein product n=1 Tax=Ambrosiozyma monospora TaxID=43982 RepID=A0ACB5TI18_AMBMO|nr:unnamed protein product [Ambrosiozyma monospora]
MRVSTRTTIHRANDENIKQNLKSKKVKEISIPTSSKSISISHNRPRRALGVVPSSALNSQSTQSSLHKQSQYQQQSEITRRSRVPVYVESDTNKPIQLHNQQQQPQQPQRAEVLSQVEEDEDIDVSSVTSDTQATDYELDDDEDFDPYEDDEEALYINEPMSPIMNESIYLKITSAYNIYSKNYLDPEDEDTFDVTMVSEYGNQIFNYLHDLEVKYAPNPKYIEEKQTELRWDHRSTLMDWLVQLHSRFNLLPETLFLSVNIIDRFLSLRAISLTRFQLCGAVALFVAAKYEEINVPTVSQMTYMVGNQFTVPEFLKAEKFMVETLKFEFGWPGPMSFLRRVG